MAGNEPAPGGPKKARPNPQSDKRNYSARLPTPTEIAKDEHIASLKALAVYHEGQGGIARAECVEIRSTHTLEIGGLRDTHAREAGALQEELGRLRPEVARLRESLANLRANAGISAAAIAVGGVAVSAAGQFPTTWQVPVTSGGAAALLCGVVYLGFAAGRSKPTPD